MAEDIQDKSVRKVLIIAYSFPPAGGGRVRRVLKFIKFLPEFGWEPVVLTVKKPIVPEYDYEILRDISNNVKIVRTFSFELAFIIRNLQAGKQKLINGKRQLSRLKIKIFKIIDRLKWWIFFPDSRNGWIIFCTLRGWWIIKKQKIDLIFVTGEPFSGFISGFLLKKLTKKPLVLDFRDEWVGFSDCYFPEKPTAIRKLERAIEGIIVREADQVISVTRPIIDNFINRYKRENREKFLCITNGFDPDDFRDLSCGARENNKFTITYAGTLYKLRTPEYFLKAIKKFVEIEPEFSKDAKIVFVGTNTSEIIELFNSDSKLKEIIEVRGFLSYKDTLNALSKSDLLLYIEDQTPISNCLLPAKLFDYMATKKAIIALANGNSVKEVIEYTGCGKIIPSHDIDSIIDNLDYFYKRFKRKESLYQEANIDRLMEFSRRNLTQKLAEAFDKVLNKKK